MSDHEYNTDGSKKNDNPKKEGDARSVLDAEIKSKAQKDNNNKK